MLTEDEVRTLLDLAAARIEVTPAPLVRGHEATEAPNRSHLLPVVFAVIAVIAAVVIPVWLVGLRGQGGTEAPPLSGQTSSSASAKTPEPPGNTPRPAPGLPYYSVGADRVSGISHWRQAPFGTETFAATGHYSGMVNNRWYVVYAGTIGGQGADAGTGGIVIQTFDAKSDTHEVDLGPFPDKGTRQLTIVSVSGDVLTLTSQSGATTTFNLETERFE